MKLQTTRNIVHDERDPTKWDPLLVYIYIYINTNSGFKKCVTESQDLGTQQRIKQIYGAYWSVRMQIV